jgi:hypothetical protein
MSEELYKDYKSKIEQFDWIFFQKICLKVLSEIPDDLISIMIRGKEANNEYYNHRIPLRAHIEHVKFKLYTESLTYFVEECLLKKFGRGWKVYVSNYGDVTLEFHPDKYESQKKIDDWLLSLKSKLQKVEFQSKCDSVD